MRKIVRLIAIGLVVFLSGCAAATGYAGKALEDARAAKDVEAKLLIAGQCGAGRGATNRLFKDAPNKLAALDLLCDGPNPNVSAPTLDASTLETMRLLLQFKADSGIIP